MSLTVTASNPRSAKRSDATTEIIRRVSSFLRWRSVGGLTMGRSLDQIQTCTGSNFMSQPLQEDTMVYDVIIAGAGPVGLFLACELRLAKLSVLVLEQLEDPHSPLKRLPFGMRGLWGPSVEAFYRRGLLEQIALQPPADGQPIPGSMSQSRGP